MCLLSMDRVHLAHCFQGEYADSCKYDEDATCPARRHAEPEASHPRLAIAEDFAAIAAGLQRLEAARFPALSSCLYCESTDGVALEDNRTRYPYEGPVGGPDDPNKPVPLCRMCAKEHHDHWDSMWEEYHSGLL